ncbi:MAG: MerR family transcriptional regulator [Butyricicoccus sp.]|nr:MerR family transcriptional regulator [Butyricicoccus sp.]
MTVKELEQELGLDRANIRFYEKEGLIHPARQENGYRDYTQTDLDELRRIRLLRQLGVSIEEIRALQSGEQELSDILAQHGDALRQEAARTAHAAEVCRTMLSAQVTYRELDAAHWLEALAQDGQDTAAEDRLPSAYAHPYRRIAARLIDLEIYRLPVLLVFALGLRLSNEIIGLLAYPLTVALMIVVEPFLLSRFGTTPGKKLCGLTLRTSEGELPCYTAAFQRTISLAGIGLGLGLPIFSVLTTFYWLYYLRRERVVAHRAELPFEPNFYWDDGAQYTAEPRERQEVTAILALAACFACGFLISAQSMIPSHNGRMTEDEYRKNHAQIERRLFSEMPQDPNSHILTIGDRLEVTEVIETDANGFVDRVVITRAGENVRFYEADPREELLAMYAFAVAGEHRTGLGYLLDQGAWRQAAELILHEGTVTIGDYTIRADRTDPGFISSDDIGVFFTQDDAGGTLRFVYEISYTPQ